MTDTRLLIGSLSNDLLRVASLTQQGSPAARRFLSECKRWASQLLDFPLSPHISKIVTEVANHQKPLNLETAERYLMYSILLQNYTLHHSLPKSGLRQADLPSPNP